MWARSALLASGQRHRVGGSHGWVHQVVWAHLDHVACQSCTTSFLSSGVAPAGPVSGWMITRGGAYIDQGPLTVSLDASLLVPWSMGDGRHVARRSGRRCQATHRRAATATSIDDGADAANESNNKREPRRSASTRVAPHGEHVRSCEVTLDPTP